MALKNLFQKYDFYASTKVPSVKRLRSGIFVFDIVTGGGIPIGRFTEFFGDKSTGKSTLSLRMVNQFLTKYKDKVAIFADFEGTYDPAWASHYLSKENMQRLYVSQPDYGEVGIEFLVHAMEEEEVGFIVVDSLATMIPIKEAESDIYTAQVGAQARLINSMFRKTLPIISKRKKQKNEITILLINQIRMKIDGNSRFGPQVTKPGGKMQDAIVSMDIRFYAKEYKKRGDYPIAIVHSFNVEKNKVGGHPKRSGEFTQYISEVDGRKIGFIDESLIVVNYAKRCGVIEKAGNRWAVLGHEFKTLGEIVEKIDTDELFAENIKNKALKKILENPLSILTTKEGKDAQHEVSSV